MKFLFAAPRFHTNQFFVVKALIDHGHQVEFLVVTTRSSEDHSLLKPRLLEYAPLYRLRKRLQPQAPDRTLAYYSFRSLARFYRSYDPDVVIIRDPKRRHSRRCALTAFLQGRQVVFYTQGEVYRPLSWLKRVAFRGLMKIFRAPWISPVKGDARKYPAAAPNVYYLPFVVEPRHRPAEPEPAKADDTVRLLMVGKYMERKNHLLLIQAVESLLGRYKLHLTVYGGYDTEAYKKQYERVKEYVQSHGLEAHVTLNDSVAFETLLEEYARNDLFVLPSRDEEAGVSLLEAMAGGLPVICSDTAGVQWYVEQDGNGRIFKSDNLPSLIEAIEYCVADSRRLQRMGRRSYELATTEHSPATYHKRMMGIMAAYGLEGAAP
ncbi:MAG: glycosyltransferase family 4 protein [Spirochaetia bacterium]|nr:glycosyltransferase family 4 protein [Spirochaetia bacterium]